MRRASRIGKPGKPRAKPGWDGSCGQEISEFCWALRPVAHAKFTAVRHHVGRVSGCRGHAAGEVFLLLLVRLLVSVVLIVTRARRLVWLRAEITSTADSRRKGTLLLYCHCSPAAGAGWYTGTSGFDTASSALRVAACLAYGVGWTHERCLLACFLAGLLLARSLGVCGHLYGCREWWSSVQQVPAASGVTRGSARLRRGE